MLEITGIRVERVQDITDKDAIAEGVLPVGPEHAPELPRNEFASLWESINAKRGFGWSVNPWVWVVEFRRVS